VCADSLIVLPRGQFADPEQEKAEKVARIFQFGKSSTETAVDAGAPKAHPTQRPTPSPIPVPLARTQAKLKTHTVMPLSSQLRPHRILPSSLFGICNQQRAALD